MSHPPGPSPVADRADWRHDADFRWPERLPWSELGPQFQAAFGRADPSDPQPEHIGIYGQNGTGKTHAAGIIYQQRAYVTRRPSVLIAHKPIDPTLAKIGWPIVNSWDQLVAKVREGQVNVIFRPRTRLMGHARHRFYDTRITDALDRFWASVTEKQPADMDIVFDDAAFIEEDLGEAFGRLKQYLREGRAPGFSVGLLKQRVQGGSRLEASETQWTLGFRPKDDDDLERWSQLFGPKRDWMPVMRTLQRDKREFLIQHAPSRTSYISWMDVPLEPAEPPRKKRGIKWMLGI